MRYKGGWEGNHPRPDMRKTLPAEVRPVGLNGQFFIKQLPWIPSTGTFTCKNSALLSSGVKKWSYLTF